MLMSAMYLFGSGHMIFLEISFSCSDTDDVPERQTIGIEIERMHFCKSNRQTKEILIMRITLCIRDAGASSLCALNRKQLIEKNQSCHIPLNMELKGINLLKNTDNPLDLSLGSPKELNDLPSEDIIDVFF